MLFEKRVYQAGIIFFYKLNAVKRSIFSAVLPFEGKVAIIFKQKFPIARNYTFHINISRMIV
jgi:hypothetical protein